MFVVKLLILVKFRRWRSKPITATEIMKTQKICWANRQRKNILSAIVLRKERKMWTAENVLNSKVLWRGNAGIRGRNWPYARSGHMVRNKLCWHANNAVGLPKQWNSYQSRQRQTLSQICHKSPTLITFLWLRSSMKEHFCRKSQRTKNRILLKH